MKTRTQTKELTWIEGKVKGFFGKEFISLTNGGLKLIKVVSLATYPEHIHLSLIHI